MKKLLLFLTICLFTASGLMAQNRQRATPEERANRQTETLTKALSLTDEQKTAIHEINLKYAQKIADVAKPDRDSRREEFIKIQDERATAIKALLTDDQKVKFDEHQKEMQSNAPNRNRN